jgi:hypothetical protein
MILLLVEDTHECSDSRPGLRDNLGHSIGVNLGGTQDIMIGNEFADPGFHLCAQP